LVSSLGAGAALRLLPAAARGERIEHPAVSRLRTAGLSFTLSEPTYCHRDGEPEPYPAGFHEVELQPGALAVAVPAAAARDDADG
jgi:diacylglycerol kinase family enzyme